MGRLEYMKEFAKGFVPYYGEYSISKHIEPSRMKKIAVGTNVVARTLALAFLPVSLPSYIIYSSLLGFFNADWKTRFNKEDNLETRMENNNEVLA